MFIQDFNKDLCVNYVKPAFSKWSGDELNQLGIGTQDISRCAKFSKREDGTVQTADKQCIGYRHGSLVPGLCDGKSSQLKSNKDGKISIGDTCFRVALTGLTPTKCSDVNAFKIV